MSVLHKLGTGLVVVDIALLALAFASSVVFAWTVPPLEIATTGSTTTGSPSTAATPAPTTLGAPSAGAAPTPTIDIWNPPEGW
jgi:hypothetical protein